MKRCLIVGMLALWACDDDAPSEGDPGLDAGPDAQIDAGSNSSLTPALADSLSKWNALAAANPGPYWYEDENCRINAVSGSSTYVQVEQGVARAVASRSFPRTECKARVNRFQTLAGAGTMPALHTQCAALLARRSDTRLGFDGEGIVNACWVGDAPNCRDNCGEGFYLLARGFGTALVPDAGAARDGGS